MHPGDAATRFDRKLNHTRTFATNTRDSKLPSNLKRSSEKHPDEYHDFLVTLPFPLKSTDSVPVVPRDGAFLGMEQAR